MMPAPKILDISQFGKREITRSVEVQYETDETDLGRKVVSIREEPRKFLEVTPWFTLDEVKTCEKELGPLVWAKTEQGWMTSVDNGVDRRRVFLSDADYKELQKWSPAEKKVETSTAKKGEGKGDSKS